MTNHPGGALPRLDNRLMAAARLFQPGDIGADIGADHGRLACYLLANNICTRMIVSDISAPALRKAAALLSRHGLMDRATLIQADGFDAIDDTVDTVAVMGMGGAVITQMLKRTDRLGHARLILSAHTGQPALRRALWNAGYELHSEEIVLSGGRYYTILQARKGTALYTDQQLYIGAGLRAETQELLTGYLAWRLAVVSAQRTDETPHHINWIREAMAHYTGHSANGL